MLMLQCDFSILESDIGVICIHTFITLQVLIMLEPLFINIEMGRPMKKNLIGSPDARSAHLTNGVLKAIPLSQNLQTKLH